MVLKALTEELAAPSVGGVRSAWTWRPLASMSPATVADVLRRASQGDGYDFLLAAADIEEKDLHYASVLQTRKLAVAGLPLKITPADNSRQAKAAAALCEDVLSRLDLPALAIDLLDGVSKGYGVGEMMWDTRGKLWMPTTVLHREPQWFSWDRDTGRDLRLVDGTPDGLVLPDYKFVLHTPKIRSGIPLMGGLARSALWAWVFKSHAMRDWASFCELFGQPMRVGKYSPGAQKDDIAVLRRAVTEIGSDAAAVIPDSMVIEFVESGSKSASADLYERLMVYMDKQVSKAVLGQTGTTDMGGSFAQSKVHEEVRGDLLQADARALASTIRRDVFRAVVALNLGPDVPLPKFELVVEEPDDMTALADQLQKLVPLGLDVEQDWVREKWGIPQPKAGAVLMRRAQAPEPVAEAEAEAETGGAEPGQAPKKPAVAAQAQTQTVALAPLAVEPDGLDAINAQVLDDGWLLLDPLLGPMQAAMDEATARGETAAQLLERLSALAPQLDGSALTSALARTAFAARLAGQGGLDAG
jgi:phage gp29-like protein